MIIPVRSPPERGIRSEYSFRLRGERASESFGNLLVLLSSSCFRQGEWLILPRRNKKCPSLTTCVGQKEKYDGEASEMQKFWYGL
jgi:hypothetical protein